VSAIVDALSVYGIRNITMPATPAAIGAMSRMKPNVRLRSAAFTVLVEGGIRIV
jgi:hypothetical protein